MTTPTPRRSINRRAFLKLLGVGSFAAVGGHLLDTYAPWLDYEELSAHTIHPLAGEATLPAQPHGLIHYATLAANAHNAQAWKFAIQGQEIQIHPDYSRALPVVDPDDRELWISLGCALENLLLAARAGGYTSEVTYPEAQDFIRVRLHPAGPQASPLFRAISLRQNTRCEYNGQPLKGSDLDQLRALPLEAGVSLHFITTPAELDAVQEYVRQGNLQQYADKSFVKELVGWLRFNKKEALVKMDGLYSRCSGNPEVPGWLGKRFVAGMKPEQQAETDTKKLRSSAGVVVISSQAQDKSSWVRTGQVYERLALQMTALNIKSAFLNQPIEVPSLRTTFARSLGLGSNHAQLAVRFGYAPSMPASLRRSVEQVLF